ncbi:NAD(P)H-binding protein [Paenibacillus phoenicis]|uniref:NAD(P)H-binding protein n=1 Tax=Paenibacillus phoenicis TaxID=554117 RepID=UPI003D2AF20D
MFCKHLTRNFRNGALEFIKSLGSSETVRLLAKQQHPARALVRDLSRTPREFSENGIDIAVGNFDRPETLDAAMHGIETVVLISFP